MDAAHSPHRDGGPEAAIGGDDVEPSCRTEYATDPIGRDAVPTRVAVDVSLGAGGNLVARDHDFKPLDGSGESVVLARVPARWAGRGRGWSWVGGHHHGRD